MKPSFKQRFKKHIIRFAGLFFLMFILRFIYGYVTPDISDAENDSYDFFSSVTDLRKNYSSEKGYKLSKDIAAAPSVASAQKYEKTATVRAKSSQFDTDVKEIKDETGKFEGVIQYEQNTGNKGSREIHLLIGINPEKFDSFYVRIQEITTVKSKEVTKIDKTNEYRQLNAKKISLEKTLGSLNELKARNGAISDYVSLHDKILEIETKLQELGVELGNFDSENEFCTVKLSLYEGNTIRKITFLHNAKKSLEWTIQYYAIIVLCMFGVTITIFILLLIIDKLNLLKSITTKLNE